MRVALYARVSTAEQRDHGISVESQLSLLHKWAEGHTIVGEYVDAGISGKKPPSKRPELSRFFSDLEKGLKVDVLVFCKLDRFLRSVKLYYQAVDVLDRYHVAWQAIQEDYETVTASGRMKVNIMLSVAENEADRTSERIKTVFEHKIEKGEAITRCQPFGYEVRDKKVVQNEYAPIAKEAFEMFAETGNTYAVRDMIQTKYGIRLPYEAVMRFLQNPLYIGSYRGNDHYCEPIVDKDLFDRVQADFAERRKTKKAPSGRIYIFSGLIVCKTCGRRMTANRGNLECKHPEVYRCPGHYLGKTCTNRRTVPEHKLEQFLLLHVAEELENVEIEVKTAERREKTVNKQSIQKKLDRLKELYIDGDIEKVEYQQQRDKLTAQLQQAPKPKTDGIKRILTENLTADYNTYTREKKRALWRSILDHVTIDPDLNIEIYFLS